ncbi:unnamed protein product [Vitrella brassicaformis CCMP3155]|uniref:Uncharacterized protein n=2 Tax=Vitrella brassicaformis TaxID=1169539 RepID=A0A0G4G648_VITBC|nr:unnamed protein product [Vitrella brassicaformis CCMP3155]|eukprot:CEM23721.1 unnamed protein product [Vitrella brassicaformis CCMP3155]
MPSNFPWSAFGWSSVWVWYLLFTLPPCLVTLMGLLTLCVPSNAWLMRILKNCILTGSFLLWYLLYLSCRQVDTLYEDCIPARRDDDLCEKLEQWPGLPGWQSVLVCLWLLGASWLNVLLNTVLNQPRVVSEDGWRTPSSFCGLPVHVHRTARAESIGTERLEQNGFYTYLVKKRLWPDCWDYLWFVRHLKVVILTCGAMDFFSDWLVAFDLMFVPQEDPEWRSSFAVAHIWKPRPTFAVGLSIMVLSICDLIFINIHDSVGELSLRQRVFVLAITAGEAVIFVLTVIFAQDKSMWVYVVSALITLATVLIRIVNFTIDFPRLTQKGRSSPRGAPSPRCAFSWPRLVRRQPKRHPSLATMPTTSTRCSETDLSAGDREKGAEGRRQDGHDGEAGGGIG